MHPRTHACLIALCSWLFVAACDDDLSPRDRDVQDALVDASADVEEDTVEDSTSPVDAQDDATEDGDVADATSTLPPLPTKPPFADAPQDPLAGSNVESCAVLDEEACVNGVVRRCHIYDTAQSAFSTTPDPLLHRVLRFDRWFDLYHNPVGQASEAIWATPTPVGAPESVWGDPANFERYSGLADAAIWNGAALLSRSMRYLNTGTEADYLRMESKVREMLLQFEVTGIPGYLARYHLLQLPDGAPRDPRYALGYGDPEALHHRFRPIDAPEAIDGLPAIYTQGYTDDTGTVWSGIPMFYGGPSIDQYSGPRTAFPVAYHLLRDDAFKARMVEHLTCYIKRLERIEIRNLLDAPELADALQKFLQSGIAQFDPDDIDLTATDTVVMYVLRNINRLNQDNFDRTCPERIHTEPWRVLDASSGVFLLELGALIGDMQAQTYEREQGIDHFYVPNVRGDDAVHMLHLAALGYHLTGDDMYRRFLFDELIGNLHADQVALTAGALDNPIWCRKFYGHHIAFTPAWAFLTLLDASPLKDAMLRVFEEEYWQKEMGSQANAKFNVMYAGEVPEPLASARGDAIAQAVQAIGEMGGNGGDFDDPRRSYTKTRAEVVASFEASGNALRCPTAQERAACEDGIDAFGMRMEGVDITSPCTGAPGECPMGDGECAEGMARDPLPVPYRNYTGFLWQHSPFAFGRDFGDEEARRQNAGLDVTEEYWLARQYGFIEEGRGQVLAWEDMGTCP